MNFTDLKIRAINHLYGPAIVLAGPGAGKIRVITESVQTLLTNHNINSKSILVTIFTEKIFFTY